MISPSVFSGAFLGWSLGANDAANVFGTAVSTKVVKYSTAVIITAIFVILGAVVDGEHGVHKLSDFAYNGGIDTALAAFFVMLSAALTVTVMTYLKFPVSTSQAVIGAIMGGGLLVGRTDFSASIKFLSAWIVTPLGAMIISFIMYKIIEKFLENRIKSLEFYDAVIKGGYILAGMFSAYSLGANNVANVTSIYAGQLNLLTTQQAVIVGGISIALGVLTYSKRVMLTVGKGLVDLSPISGFVSVMAAALTVYIYALIGIPVSTSQAIVGAVIGIGLVKGVKAINMKTVKNIMFAWFGTPTIAGLVSFGFSFIYHM
ncbi:inorganic phosphate transporter [Vallitalea okinawensis]|uniref:inorganic phosphate transporter n=1 Tax=Vallitalea okinawensis TaxID=2078660 RepID=UPI001A9A46C7|nr:inorganic phosphate transporter [Vallitalea okinawensis]